jgi:uncharacterized pyridoxal phosphate-containing UPF0001 family protein
MAKCSNLWFLVAILAATVEDQQHNKKSSLISTVNKTESVTQVTLVTENIKKNGQSVHFDEKNKLDLTSPIQRGTSRESVKSHNSTEPQLTEEVIFYYAVDLPRLHGLMSFPLIYL